MKKVTTVAITPPELNVITTDEHALRNEPATIEICSNGRVIFKAQAKVVSEQGADMSQYPVVKFEIESIGLNQS